MRNMNIHTMLILALALWSAISPAQAQNITGYRYWFNDNAGALTEMTLAPTPIVEAELVLNSASLAPGHHLATIQFRDADGHWGAPWTGHFVQRDATVSALEYWFNDDAGATTTVAVTPGLAPQIDEALTASTLPVGFHTVTMRTVDERGERSIPYTVTFTRNGGAITGYEYWIDDAIADRSTGSIGPAGTVELITELPVPTTEGDHTFTIRFRDEAEGWSVPLSSVFSFAVGMNEIPGVSNYLLFPNPVDEQLTLRVDAIDARTLQVEVLDATGRFVQQFAAWNVSGIAHNTWDTSSLTSGSYLLRISSSDRAMQLPFVKQ